MAYNFNLMS